MFNPIQSWPKLKSNFEEFADWLKKWYALAIQEEDTKGAIKDFLDNYKIFCRTQPIQPYFDQGRVPPQYQRCLYLHNLYRRTPIEQAEYLKYLQELNKCDYQKDLLKLAKHLVLEYSEESDWLECVLEKDIQEQLYRNARRALMSLTNDQKKHIYETNALDHITALLVFLVRSKIMLDRILRLPKNDPFLISASNEIDLEHGKISKELIKVFELEHYRLSANAEIKLKNNGKWELCDGPREYEIEKGIRHLTVRLIKDAIRVAIIVPVHQEMARLKPRVETLSGEDFLARKVEQLEFLLDNIPTRAQQGNSSDLKMELTFCCDEDEMYEAMIRSRKDSIKSSAVKINIVKVPADLDTPNSKSNNIKYGFSSALKNGVDYIGYTDADMSTNLGQLGALLYAIVNENAEAAIGSRNLPESWVFGRDPFRAQQSRFYNWLVQLFLGISIRDTQAGFKLFTAKAARQLVKHAFTDQTMAFDSELLAHLNSHDFRIREVPVVWFESPLESQSTSTKTAISMVQGLFQQGKDVFARSKVDPLSYLQENPLRDNLISLGTNKEFIHLMSFCFKYYDLIQPYYLRLFVDSLKTLFYAISRNELTEDEFQEFLQMFQLLLNNLPESQVIDYVLNRYPELLEIAHAIWQDYRTLKPIACFLVGSRGISKFLPDTTDGIQSFYDYLYNKDMAKSEVGSQRNDSSADFGMWLEYYRLKPNNTNKHSKERESLPTTVKGRRSSARKLLEDGCANDAVIHLIIPALGTVTKNRHIWNDQNKRDTSREISNIAKKIDALKLLYRGIGVENKLAFEFYFMTGLTPDMIPLSQDPTNPIADALYKLREVVRDSKVKFTLYAVDDKKSSQDTTFLTAFRLENNNGKPIEANPVQIHHAHRNPAKELLTVNSPRGTLLFMGFNLAHQVVKESDKAFIGYTTAAAKIPLDEFIILLKALMTPNCGSNPKRIAVGSRRLSESEVSNKPMLNHLRSAILNLCIRALYPDLSDLADTQAACKLLTPEMVNCIFLSNENPSFTSTGLECDVEMLQLGKYHNGDLIEVPISFYESMEMEESLGTSEGFNLITALLKLKGNTPNLNQKPDTVEYAGVKYRNQYIGSGTEHMIFKLERVVADPLEASPVVVKVPHEAIDTEFYLRLDSLCFNWLRLAGLSQATTRTDLGGLITNNPLLNQMLFSGNKKLTNWIMNLRNWNEFNTVALKMIRAYEGKTYKSSGYKNGLGVDEFVVPYHILSDNERVVVRWNSGLEKKRDYIFDSLDHVIVMDFVEDNMEKFLSRMCKKILDDELIQDKQELIVQVFTNCIQAAYAFSINMATQARLYDLDMNMWADIGIIHPDDEIKGEIRAENLRLLDPGELESRFSAADTRRCVEILCKKLDTGKKKNRSRYKKANVLAKLSKLDYSSKWFKAFQFRQLDMLMDQYGLSHEKKEELHNICAEEVKSHIESLLYLRSQTRKSNPKTGKVKGDWCIFKSPSPDSNKEREQKKDQACRQISAIMLGGEIQGKYSYTRPAEKENDKVVPGKDIEDKLSHPRLDEYRVYASKRGISIEPELDDKSSDDRSRPIRDTLLINRENVKWNGNEEALYNIPVDSFGIPYRGAIATAINALYPKDKQKKVDPRVVILDAGVSLRMSLISLIEGSKGEISLDKQKLWQQAAARYGEIAQKIDRTDLIVFGAADTLVNIGPQSTFLDALKDYFNTEDRVSGRKPGIFFFQLPFYESKEGETSIKREQTILIPQSSSEQDQWILNFLPDCLDDMRPFVPFLHLFKHQQDKLRKVDKSGYGFWFRGHSIPGSSTKNTRLALPIMSYPKALFRYLLISDAIKHFGGLRSPFLFILSQPVAEKLHRDFFESLDARPAEKLDWYNTIVLGFSSMDEGEFIQAHSKHLNRRQAQSLYRLLQEIKREFWSEFHQKEAQKISEHFYKDAAENRVCWHAFESPVDVFNYYYTRKTAKNYKKNRQTIEVYMDASGVAAHIKFDVPNQEVTGPNKTFAVVIAGNVPKANFKLKLELPLTDVAKRSNFYPYLVYFSSKQQLADLPPIQICAHELCIIDSVDIGKLKTTILELPFVNLSKEATLKTAATVSILGEGEQRTTTVGALLREPAGVPYLPHKYSKQDESQGANHGALEP